MPQKRIGLLTLEISKGMINENSFIDLFSFDSDFTENEEYFREDTLELGFKNEAERCSKELFEKHKKGLIDRDTEDVSLELALIDGIENTRNFIGQSYYYNYGEYQLRIIETDFSYVVAIAVANQT